MKSEVLYAYTINTYELDDLRFSLAYTAEERSVPHLSFKNAFKTSSLEKACFLEETYDRMIKRLSELGHRRIGDSDELLVYFSTDYGSGMGGREFRNIYSTNDDAKLIIIDEAEDRDHAVLTNQVVSLISDISTEERKLIGLDIIKLLNR